MKRSTSIRDPSTNPKTTSLSINQSKAINLKNMNLNPLKRNTIMALLIYHHLLMCPLVTCPREFKTMPPILIRSMINTFQKVALRVAKWLRIMWKVLEENSCKPENQATINTRIIPNGTDRTKKIIMSQRQRVLRSKIMKEKAIKMMMLEPFLTKTFANLSGVDSILHFFF